MQRSSTRILRAKSSISSAEAVYRQLRDELIGGRIAAGSKLPSLRQLAQQHDAKVNHVRQAIQRLEEEKLVEARHGSGVYAADMANRTREVLLISPGTGDDWADYTHAIIHTLSSDPRNHVTVESGLSAYVSESEQKVLQEKIAKQIDRGVDVVIFNGMNEFSLGFLRQYADCVPLICFSADQVLHSGEYGRVVSDWHHGGYAGMRHLIEVGCRRIAVSQFIEPPVNILGDFIEGARLAAADSMSPVEVVPIITSVHDSTETIQARLEQLFGDSSKPVDGFFGHSDWIAARAIAYLHRKGLKVPDDVAVMGYYDTPWTVLSDPQLSSVSTQHVRIAETIKQMLDENRLTSQHVIRPQLIVRESTRRN